MNEILVVSDGLQTLAGTLTAGREWFKPWRTIEGEELAPVTLPTLEVLIRGVFDKARFLDLVRDFVVFEDDGGGGISQESGWLPPVPRSAGGRGPDLAGGPVGRAFQGRWVPTLAELTAGRVEPPATGGSAWSGIRRGQARV